MQDLSLIEAIVITLLSMIVVFIVLILISCLIGVLKNFGQNKPKEDVNSNFVEEPQELDKQMENNNDEELVAVIAAAVAASMGLKVPDIKIKKIKRIHGSIWSDTARLEQMN